MSIKTISREELDRALELRDLTDPNQGQHAMQVLLNDIHGKLSSHWNCDKLLYRSCPIVSVKENYDDLGYPREGVARDARYTRYVSKTTLLRTQTSAAIPVLLRALHLQPLRDLLLICPGLAYRRDVIDRLHVGEPHQLDLWRLKRGQLGKADLLAMIELIVDAALPGHTYRTTPAEHPYTIDGLQIDVEVGGAWVEIGECGLSNPDLLRRCGHDPEATGGLAMGLGLDRLLMLRKGIQDIRLLRSEDPRITRQMTSLEKYRAVSNQPAVQRDLSVAVEHDLDAEQLGDRVRAALGSEVDSLESLQILSETPYECLPPAARERIGIHAGQKNLLIRLVIRHPTRTLTAQEANHLRDEVYLKIHRGGRAELTKCWKRRP